MLILHLFAEGFGFAWKRLAGLFLVFLFTFIPFGSLAVVLTFKNIVLGIGVSIGIVAGIVPAAMAARLDPVNAIRA